MDIFQSKDRYIVAVAAKELENFQEAMKISGYENFKVADDPSFKAEFLIKNDGASQVTITKEKL